MRNTESDKPVEVIFQLLRFQDLMQAKFRRQNDIPKPAVEMKMGQRNISKHCTITSTHSSTKCHCPAGFWVFPADIPLAVLKQLEWTSRSGTMQYKVHGINIAYLYPVSNMFLTACSGFPPLPTPSHLARAPLSLSQGGRTHQLSQTKKYGSLFLLSAVRAWLTASCS